MSNTDLLPYLKNKYVELTVGDEYEEIMYSDNVRKIASSLFGLVIDIVGDFIILDCLSLDKSGKLKPQTRVFINTWNIKTITELKTDNDGLGEVFLSTGHSKLIKEMLGLSGAKK